MSGPALPERWKEAHQRVLAGAIERSDEDPFQGADGEPEWIQWESRPWRRADGSVGGLLLFTQVITERKQGEARQRALESQLRQAQKLDAIGTLAGGIAHDFNNILAAITVRITAHAELARMDCKSDGELKDNLAGILQATWRASKLVEQILTFSRKQPQERTHMQLAPVVTEALALLRSTLPSTIELVPRIAAGLPQVLANSTHMHQVLINLCTNAGHAMRGKPGKLTVQLDEFSVSDEDAQLGVTHPGNYLRLTVGDTGHGMSEEVLQCMFDPFFTTKGIHEGTGLGLAVVHGIVQEHQGFIRVESKVGVGSTFRILLPAHSQAETSVNSKTEIATRGRGQRILLVDDEPLLAEAICKLLTRWGYTVTVFSRSTEALDAFSVQPHAFDLMLTDLTMPELDGLALTRQVLARRPELPIVLTTGSFNESTQEVAHELGIRRVLLKPVDYTKLLVSIATSLDEAAVSSAGTATSSAP